MAALPASAEQNLAHAQQQHLSIAGSEAVQAALKEILGWQGETIWKSEMLVVDIVSYPRTGARAI